MSTNPIQKKCFNYCPNCGATDPNIEWGDKEWLDTQAYQEAECKKCGCVFKEYYTYSDTEFERNYPETDLEKSIITKIPGSLIMELLGDAEEIVNDFDQIGEVLQTDGDDGYGPNSPIEQLRTTLKKCKEKLKI
jgi:hypothetical protein